MPAALDQLTAQHQQHLDWLKTLCRFSTVSTLPEHKPQLVEAASWLKQLCEQIGLQTEIIETPGHAAVFAQHIVDPAAPTYLVYGHYDVQPIGDRSLWDHDPFEPVIDGDWLVCRGSADNKGQIWLYLRAMDAWLRSGEKLPVNVKILIEGEEEIGSPHLAGLIEQHRDKLACQHILISDTGMYADGWPTITYGTRGLVYKEIRLKGPKHDLHSGSFGGSIANPVNVLCELIADLHDADGRVTIPGFYDDVVEPTADERAQFAKLPFDEQQYLQDTGAPGVTGEAGWTTNERRSMRPTLDANGIYGGFQGEGANTIIPARCGAKVSMRLVPNQNAKKIAAQFDEAITTRCPHTVQCEILQHGNADAYMAPLDSRPMSAAKTALQQAFNKAPALIREGGSLPILPMFKQLLGADSLMLGFASPNCNAHGPNEKYRLPDADRGAAAIVSLLGALGDK